MALDRGIKAKLDSLIAQLNMQAGDAYAGIGSRETPHVVLAQMTQIASYLAEFGFVLRSGGAPGADTAFELGAPAHLREIFLPWRGFNGNRSHHYKVPLTAMKMGRDIHPRGQYLTPAVTALMGRNCQQILGSALHRPAKVVICWTRDGADGLQVLTSEKTGGTGQAIRLAVLNSVPVLNLQPFLLV